MSDTSVGGKARDTISRQSAQRARCSRTVALFQLQAVIAQKMPVSASASGWLTAGASDLQALTNDIWPRFASVQIPT